MCVDMGIDACTDVQMNLCSKVAAVVSSRQVSSGHVYEQVPSRHVKRHLLDMCHGQVSSRHRYGQVPRSACSRVESEPQRLACAIAHIGMNIDMCIGMCIGMCIHMCIGVCTGTCTDICTGMFTCNCIGISV